MTIINALVFYQDKAQLSASDLEFVAERFKASRFSSSAIKTTGLRWMLSSSHQKMTRKAFLIQAARDQVHRNQLDAVKRE